MAGSEGSKAKPRIDPRLLTATVEKPQKIGEHQTSLRIGIPREAALQENRVALTPRAVGVLIANGHEVYVETKAGQGAQFSDHQYSENGAIILYEPQELYGRADIIAKITPLNEQELEYLRPHQTIISAVHMGQMQADYLKALMQKSITAIGYEFIVGSDGSVPFMKIMSQIAGIASVHIAAEMLSAPAGGKGLLFGGITGVPPIRVGVIGAGTVGRYATMSCIGLGADVRVIDEEIPQLQELERSLPHRISTSLSSPDIVEEITRWADVLIGAAYIKGYRAPLVVTEDMVMEMREGSVIIDVAIDQGGCIETSRVTNHRNPAFVVHGVKHYCVPNIASRVARTGAMSISNMLMPLLLKIGQNGGVKSSLGREASITSGIYVYHKHITQRALARVFDLDFMDIELLYAADM